MYNIQKKLSAARNYFEYWSQAGHSKGRRIHSPLVYEFVTNALFKKESCQELVKIEKLREKCLRDESKLYFQEMGGSAQLKNPYRSVDALARETIIKKKYGEVLFNINRHYRPEKVLELGTSIGFSSLYMALGYSSSTIYTLEGNRSVIDVAKTNAKSIGISNIKYYEGNFNKTLDPVLKEMGTIDLAFVDGNHTYSGTLEYFKKIKSRMPQGIIVFDDIYWSKGMKQAWNEIKASSAITIDIYQFGIVFVNYEATPGHYRVRY